MPFTNRRTAPFAHNPAWFICTSAMKRDNGTAPTSSSSWEVYNTRPRYISISLIIFPRSLSISRSCHVVGAAFIYIYIVSAWRRAHLFRRRLIDLGESSEIRRRFKGTGERLRSRWKKEEGNSLAPSQDWISREGGPRASISPFLLSAMRLRRFLLSARIYVFAMQQTAPIWRCNCVHICQKTLPARCVQDAVEEKKKSFSRDDRGR